MGAIDRVFRGRRPAQQRPAAAIVAGLWKNGEQGVWYNPSDLSTMFQDAAGATPVYMPGQGQIDPPVGLLLDKRLGLTRGPELWVDASAQLFGEASRVAPGVYRVYTSAGAYTAVQLSGLIAGEWYELSLNVDLITTLGNGLACDVTTPVVSFNSVGPKKYLLQTNTNVIAIKRNANILTDIQISSVSVRRIPGNHAFQPSTTSRPTLSARYNLLMYSEQFDAAAWTKVECAVSPNVALGPNSVPADKMIPSANTAQHYITCSGGTATESRTAVVVAKADGISKVTLWPGASATFAHFDLVDGTTSKEANVLSTTMRALGDGWYELWVTWAAVAATSLRIYASGGSMGAANTPGDGTAGILLERADLRSASDGVGLPPYQCVFDANTYDTVGFPPYLKFDGVDDWLQTANIDFSGTGKVGIFTAVRKLTDASRGVIIELGPNGYGQPDSFNQEQAWFSPNFSGSYSGSAGSATLTKPGVAAPLSAVLSTLYDKPGSLARLRYNGQHAASNNSSVGSGGFLNAPLFVGRRGGSSSPAAMRLYGAIVRGASTSDATVSKIERYLNAKAKVF